MRIVRTFIECDRCHVEVEQDEAQAHLDGWFTGLFRLGGKRRPWHICPTCVVAWLDPEEDFAAERTRILLEDRLGAPDPKWVAA